MGRPCKGLGKNALDMDRKIIKVIQVRGEYRASFIIFLNSLSIN
jgi:hypothetical protein